MNDEKKIYSMDRKRTNSDSSFLEEDSKIIVSPRSEK